MGNKLHPERRPADGHLVDYLELIEYVVPEAAEAGEVGEVGEMIRRLRRTLDAGRELTANQRERGSGSSSTTATTAPG